MLPHMAQHEPATDTTRAERPALPATAPPLPATRRTGEGSGRQGVPQAMTNQSEAVAADSATTSASRFQGDLRGCEEGEGCVILGMVPRS